MYFFVRFNGIVAVVVGVLLMLLGFGAAIYGFVQHAAMLDLVNNYLLAAWLASQNQKFSDVRFYTTLFGLGLFLVGMIVSGLGQLMLVFADTAANTKETNLILRGMRKVE